MATNRAQDEFPSAGFDCCAGAVDGVHIWTNTAVTTVDPAKFFYSQKHKIGWNCQAVRDSRGRFLSTTNTRTTLDNAN
jgi:hypothetical protein